MTLKHTKTIHWLYRAGILASDTKTNYFWYSFEPLTPEIWNYFSSVGEVYAAQPENCGAFFIGGSMAQSKHANQRLTLKQDSFCLTFAGTAGLVARGGMSRRW